MTNTEFSDSFDTLLNSYNSQAQFGEQASKNEIVLDEYEKSVLLTQAQDIIVKSFFDRKTNAQGDGFDDSTRRQVDFSSLIKTASLSPVEYDEEEGEFSPAFDDRGIIFNMPMRKYPVEVENPTLLKTLLCDFDAVAAYNLSDEGHLVGTNTYNIPNIAADQEAELKFTGTEDAFRFCDVEQGISNESFGYCYNELDDRNYIIYRKDAEDGTIKYYAPYQDGKTYVINDDNTAAFVSDAQIEGISGVVGENYLACDARGIMDTDGETVLINLLDLQSKASNGEIKAYEGNPEIRGEIQSGTLKDIENHLNTIKGLVEKKNVLVWLDNMEADKHKLKIYDKAHTEEGIEWKEKEGSTDVLFILNEQLKTTIDTLAKTYVIVPINYKEYDREMSKAYAQPLKKQAWRMFQNDTQGFDIQTELIPRWNLTTKETVTAYKIRYIRRPCPIVLVDLPNNLEIDGFTKYQECELNPILHPEILQKALEIAISTRGNVQRASRQEAQ